MHRDAIEARLLATVDVLAPKTCHRELREAARLEEVAVSHAGLVETQPAGPTHCGAVRVHSSLLFISLEFLSSKGTLPAWLEHALM
jgi:hypothetical protein